MKNQEYTYIYGNRGIQNNEELFDYKVKFENKYIEQKYSRPVNPADIAYLKEVNKNAMEVYKTREVVANHFGGIEPENVVFTKNCTEALNIVIQGICNKKNGNL